MASIVEVLSINYVVRKSVVVGTNESKTRGDFIGNRDIYRPASLYEVVVSSS